MYPSYNYNNPDEFIASDPIGALQSGIVGDQVNGTAIQGVTTGGATTSAPTGPSAADRQAAADRARAGQLRDSVTGLVNTIKDIFNSRYGQVDASAKDQTNRLNKRFGTESSEITRQVEGENNQASGAFAGRGTRDSSDYGNTVDSITRSGESQINELGQGLEEDLAKVGGWAAGEKAKYNAEKKGADTILSRLAEETDPGRLTELRNSLDARIVELQAGGADNNTTKQNLSTLESIAPSNARAQQLKTTLSQIVGGNAAPALKNSIGTRLIQNAGLSDEEQQKLIAAFQGEISQEDKTQA